MGIFIDSHKKKGLLLFLLSIVIILIGLEFVHSQNSIFGSIEILDTSGPIVNLIEPLNNSGNINENVTFFYNVSDASNVDNCSLIINNEINLTDISVTEDTKISFILNHTSLGSYNWSINCTDNSGYVGISDNRTVTVNFMTNFNGSTTNISLVNVKNVTNFVLERTDSGKINFSEGVDLSQGLDLDKYINISQNRIKLNSTVLNELNKSATLYLYGLTFSNPRVLRDGSVCPSSICKEVSYSGGIFIFNVTQFTVYSSEETPSSGGETQTTTGGGGGGGGGGSAGGGAVVPIEEDFSINKNLIKITLAKDRTAQEKIRIKNTGNKVLKLEMSIRGIEDFIPLPTGIQEDITLDPEEEKTLILNFNVPSNKEPGIYTGKVVIASNDIKKIVDVIIEVESAEPLFDIEITIPRQYQQVYPGDDIFATIRIFNLGIVSRVDTTIEYFIKDLEGNIIISEHESVAVETQASLVKSFELPIDIKLGRYVLYAKTTYNGFVGSSSHLFEVVERPKLGFRLSSQFKIILGIVGLALLVITVFIIISILDLLQMYKKELQKKESFNYLGTIRRKKRSKKSKINKKRKKN